MRRTWADQSDSATLPGVDLELAEDHSLLRDDASSTWPNDSRHVKPASAIGPRSCRARARRVCLIFVGLVATVLLVILLILLFVEIPVLELHRLNPALEFSLARWTLRGALAHCDANPRQADIIVSMTTLPLRLPYLQRTLKSLLLQSACPRAIHVWVPRENVRLPGQVYDVPEWLKSTLAALPMRRDTNGTLAPRIVLHQIDRDYGPATKLLPTLLHLSLAPTQRILVVDDDVLYSRRMVEQYACFTPLLPDAALGFHGKVHLPSPDDGRFKPGTFKRAQAVDLLLGTSSFLVQPRFFPNLTVAVDYSALAPFAYPIANGVADLQRSASFEDDWYWAFMLLHARVPRVAVPIDHTQLEQADTMIFVGRGSLTSTVNSHTADPIYSGRANAIAVARAYRLLALQRSLRASLPMPRPIGLEPDAPASAFAEYLAHQCPLEPRDPWQRCDEHLITRWACGPVHSFMSLLP